MRKHLFKIGTLLLFALGISYYVWADIEDTITITVTVPGTQITFYGQASPNAFVTFYRDAYVIGTRLADADGNFSFVYPDADIGLNYFTLISEDQSGRTTPNVEIQVEILSRESVTYTDIFLPPTIELLTDIVYDGGIITVAGEAQPDADIVVYIPDVHEIFTGTATSSGVWSASRFADFGAGYFELYAISNNEGGLTSEHSRQVYLTVGEMLTPTPSPTPLVTPTPSPTPTDTECCERSDLNCDNQVSLPDFSILMYHWGKSHECADANDDGVVSLPDFSIMMYDWST